MRLITTAVLMIISISAFSQISNKFRVKPRFIDFEKARLSAGIGFNTGWANLSPEPENFTQGYKGRLSLLFDFYSPLSVVGFVSGVQYGAQESKIGPRKDNLLTGDSIFVNTIEVPFFVKFRMGAVSSKFKFILMPGIAYNFVQSARIESDYFPTIKDKTLGKNFLDYRLRVGLEIAVGRKSRKEYDGKYVSDARTRLIVYIGTSYSKSPVYDENFKNLPDDSLSDFSELGVANTFNYYGGVTAFFTLSKWGDFGGSLIDGFKN